MTAFTASNGLLTSSPPLMAGIPSTGRPCPTASACADSFSKAPTSRTPMRDGELPEIFVLSSNCLMAKEEFGTVVATEGSLPPSRPSRHVRSDLGLNPEACRSILMKGMVLKRSDGAIFLSYLEAEESMRINRSAIHAAANGRTKSCGGFAWSVLLGGDV